MDVCARQVLAHITSIRNQLLGHSTLSLVVACTDIHQYIYAGHVFQLLGRTDIHQYIYADHVFQLLAHTDIPTKCHKIERASTSQLDKGSIMCFACVYPCPQYDPFGLYQRF
jgi:hypothetical protein